MMAFDDERRIFAFLLFPLPLERRKSLIHKANFREILEIYTELLEIYTYRLKNALFLGIRLV